MERWQSALGRAHLKSLPVQQDDQCPFGKWLHGLRASVQATPDYLKVQELHAQFHTEAANVLGFALKKQRAHRDHKLNQPRELEWLPIEWPRGETEPRKYWLSNLAENIRLRDLVALAKQRWMIDYEELKQELGLGHFEGRGWRGFHHHATLCIAAYGFLVAERSRFSPSARSGYLGLRTPQLPPGFQPRGSNPPGTA